MKKKLLLHIILFQILLSARGQVITTIAGTGVAGFSGDSGAAISAKLNVPKGLSWDINGDLLIADTQNDRIRKITNLGIITTIAGGGSTLYGDGGPAIDAWLSKPTEVKLDLSGNLYISDWLDNAVRVVNVAGIINVFAGDYIMGYGGDGMAAVSANLNHPTSVAWRNGNLYIADRQNNRIREVNSSGIINTWAGNGSGTYSGDGGQATSAGLCCPYVIAFDPKGNFYFNDGSTRIRKINSLGIVSTFAGGSSVGYSGDGGPATMAQIFSPFGMTFDLAGNMYFSDSQNNCVRKIDTLGIITTIIGTTTQGYSGDGGLAINAQLYGPNGLAFDAVGNLYIADAGNNVIRKVTNVGVVGVKDENHLENINLYPNPCNEFVYLETGSADAAVQISNSMGAVIYSSAIHQRITIDVKDFMPGIYFVEIKTSQSSVIKKISVQH